MKPKLTTLTFIFALVTLSAMAQTKSKESSTLNALLNQEKHAGLSPAQMERTLTLLIGTPGIYLLTDFEGGVDFDIAGQPDPNGRRTYAIITEVVLRRNPDRSLFINADGNYEFARDKNGHILVDLRVFRGRDKCETIAGFRIRCGAFDRLNASFTSLKEPGSFDLK